MCVWCVQHGENEADVLLGEAIARGLQINVDMLVAEEVSQADAHVLAEAQGVTNFLVDSLLSPTVAAVSGSRRRWQWLCAPHQWRECRAHRPATSIPRS